jgi:hypothetical protein
VRQVLTQKEDTPDMRLRLASLIVTGSLLALGVVPAALAADADEVVYGGAPGNVQQDLASGALGNEGTLPFTGLNLALIIVAGVALIATGILLKRRSSTTS